MKYPVLTIGLAVMLTAMNGAYRTSPAKPATVNRARLLTCTLGHALNLDPSKDQTASDIRYEGRYAFSLFLPSTVVRPVPRPDETLKIVPVNPATRIVSDPSGLRQGVSSGFATVVDLWPERVEMTQVIEGPLVHFIVISGIDERKRTANLFMTTATDVAAMNLKTVYQGPCRIKLLSKSGI